MSVFEGSRYEHAGVERVKAADGITRPAVYSVVAPGRRAFRTYVFREYDRLDLLAHSLYGDAALWWVIADINPEYLSPLDIPVGATIRLPVT